MTANTFASKTIIRCQKNARLLVTVVPSPDAELLAERDEWTAFALQNLARAYGDDEPECTDEMLIERNPLYDPLYGKR